MSVLLKLDYFKTLKKNKDFTFIFWIAAYLCGPLADVIQQNVKSGHAVSEDSLEHPTACYWCLLKSNQASCIMINTQWTFETKVTNEHPLQLWNP